MAASTVGAGHAGEFLELSTGDLVTDGPRSTLPAAYRIKNLAVGMQCEETGRADLRRQLGGRKPPVGRVEGGMVDALGSATARPEEDIERLGHANGKKSEK